MTGWTPAELYRPSTCLLSPVSRGTLNWNQAVSTGTLLDRSRHHPSQRAACSPSFMSVVGFMRHLGTSRLADPGKLTSSKHAEHTEIQQCFHEKAFHDLRQGRGPPVPASSSCLRGCENTRLFEQTWHGMGWDGREDQQKQVGVSVRGQCQSAAPSVGVQFHRRRRKRSCLAVCARA